MNSITTFLITLIFAISSIPGLAQTPPSLPGTIVLDRGWQTPIQGGSATMKDLGALLSPFAQGKQQMTPSPKFRMVRV